ncbi:hypothetical protein Nans01_14550 [Nocardiopsis ansamitocini]|uniref:Hint domain-containing protein n=1 Tax=Nocardiopsis ansamitocini TaxID=1670832 RepID=A0A9W6UHX8_9ACTN|nr:hypothetical protein Nans01_14550 [Nocardiopsis ansamitocini]
MCASECTGTGGLTQPANARGTGVNTATGGYADVFPDAQVASAQAPFALDRSYSSRNSSSGALGPGWTLPWETSLETGADGRVVLREESGARLTFTRGSGTSYTAPTGARSVLRGTDTGWQLDTPDRRTLRYDTQGRLASVTSRGQQQLALSYTGDKPTTLTDSAGREYQFDYTGAHLTRVTLPDGRSTRYGYTGGRLTSVRALDGATTTYGYDPDGRLDHITGPDGHALLGLVYDAQGRVTEQTDAVGAVTRFAYTTANGFDTTHTTTPSGGIWTDLYSRNVLFAQIDPFGNATSHTYDADLNRTSVQDPLGRITTYTYNTAKRLTQTVTAASSTSWTYDANGNVTRATDGAARAATYEYTAAGLLAATVDSLGNRTVFTYTAAGLLESVTTPEGNTSSFEYDAHGNQTAVVSPSGAREERTYDTAGRLLSVTDPRGHDSANPQNHTTAFTYDDADRVTSRTLPGGGTEHFTYDAYGNPTASTDAADRTTTYTYSSPGRLEEVSAPGDATTTYAYDAAGNLTEATGPDGATTSHTYDEADRHLTTVTPRGNAQGADPQDFTWTFGYDAAGQQSTVTDPLGNTTAYAYDADSRVIQTTDPLGTVRKSTYDRGGLLTTVVDGNNRTETLRYDTAGQLIRFTDRRAKNFTYAYDADGNLTTSTTPTGAATTYAYTTDGLLASVVDPRGNAQGADPQDFTWTYAYDQAGLLASVTDPLGHTQTSTHDGRGLVTAMTDALGNTTAYAYDALGRVETLTAPDGGTTGYTYDPAGTLASRTDANGHTTDYGYDDAGRLTSVTDPLDRVRTLDYDPEGNLTRETNARGHTTTYRADALGRTTRADYSDTTPTVTIVYDAAGRPVQVTDGTGTRSFTNLDGEGRPRTVMLPTGQGSMAYTYDNAGNIASIRTRDNQTTRYVYNDDGQMVSQDIAASHKTEYAYDPAGNLTTVTSPTGNGHTETRTYDPANLLSGITTGKAGTALSTWALTRDPNGQPLQVDAVRSGQAGRQIFAYDDNGRLTQECATTPDATACPAGPDTTTYTYDQVGNRLTAQSDTTTTYAYDAADQLTSVVSGTTTTPYAYDADGNLTSDGTAAFDYNAPGSLTDVTTPQGTYTYAYDADGNRTSASHDGQLQRTSTWDILHPLPQLISDYDGAGALTANYTYNPHGQIQTQRHATGGNQQYHLDWLGSVADTTNATGTPQHQYAYSGFGLTDHTWTSDGAPANPFTYTGQYAESTTDAAGLYLRDRDYRPDLGRFTSTDPEPRPTATPHTNAYAYAENLPTTLTDPSGRCPMCVSIGIGAVLGGVIEGGAYALTTDNATWGGLAQAAGRGAVIGAVGGALMPGVGNLAARSLSLTGGRALTLSVGVNAGVGAGFTWAVNAVQCRPTSPTDLLLGALGGGAGGLIGPGLSKLGTLLGPRAAAGAGSSTRAGGVVDTVNRSERGAVDRLAGCTGNSFVAGTPVLMADGTFKPIEQVEVGDEVAATDPGTGEQEAKPVLATITGTGEKDLVTITVDTITRTPAGEGDATDGEVNGASDGAPVGEDGSIVATGQHPFWVPELGEWVNAGDLAPGMWLQTSAGTWVQVSAVKAWTQSTTVHNLTVADIHTYHVLAGDTPVLAHNCGSGAADLGHLIDRADELHSLIPSGGQRYRTTGVLHADGVGGGIDLSAVGARSNLTLIQRGNSLDAGELAISMTNGAHTEVKLVTAAQHLGIRPGGIAVSRPFCSDCSKFLTGQGAVLVSPRSALWHPFDAK